MKATLDDKYQEVFHTLLYLTMFKALSFSSPSPPSPSPAPTPPSPHTHWRCSLPSWPSGSPGSEPGPPWTGSGWWAASSAGAGGYGTPGRVSATTGMS